MTQTIFKKKGRDYGVKEAAGDNYGLGSKAKVGKMRSDSVGYRPVSKKQLATPPRSTV